MVVESKLSDQLWLSFSLDLEYWVRSMCRQMFVWVIQIIIPIITRDLQVYLSISDTFLEGQEVCSLP